MKKPLLIICGPTGIGKTSLALSLAKKFDGELVSADSRQVYTGMDVVTGKDLSKSSKFKAQNSKLQRKIQNSLHLPVSVGYHTINNSKVWGLDLVEPNDAFEVASYVRVARAIIEAIWERGKLPILVGGTGFYIHSLLQPRETFGVRINKALRARLEKMNVIQLQAMLEKKDRAKWHSLNHSDRYNPRRLVRAIEVASARIKKQEVRSKRKSDSFVKQLDVKWVGLRTDLNTLRKKIAQRVKTRLQNGAEDEIKTLISKGYSWDLPSMSALGYRDWQAYLEGKVTKEGLIEQWSLHELQYVKRQMVWFRKEREIDWLDVGDKSYIDKVTKTVREWQEEKK